MPSEVWLPCLLCNTICLTFKTFFVHCGKLVCTPLSFTLFSTIDCNLGCCKINVLRVGSSGWSTNLYHGGCRIVSVEVFQSPEVLSGTRGWISALRFHQCAMCAYCGVNIFVLSPTRLILLKMSIKVDHFGKRTTSGCPAKALNWTGVESA